VANPPTDIVLGVALAADPERYRAAAERLRSMSAEAAPARNADSVAFGASVEKAAGKLESRPAVLANVSPRVNAAPARRTGDAFAQLEAFVLQTFIQSMLPKNAAHVFGKGTAGEIWKSMLAEKLGAEIAGSGQLGIAARLASASAAGALSAAHGAMPPASDATASNASDPSTASGQG
jgi:hypothetical protein